MATRLSAAILTLVIAAIYSAAIYCLQPEKVWDWLTTLVASGVSFFLAILTGIYLFNQQTTASENSERKNLRSLLGAEFSDLIRILSDTSTMQVTFPSGKIVTVLIAFVQPLVIERAATSGLFTSIESENLLHLARKIRMLNFKSEYFLGLVQSKPEESLMQHAIDNIEQTRCGAIDGLSHVAKQMGIDINEHYPE